MVRARSQQSWWWSRCRYRWNNIKRGLERSKSSSGMEGKHYSEAKPPRKWDLAKLTYWKRINLLSAPDNVFILPHRLRQAIDRTWKEQVGFWSGRGCTGQMIVLRNIVEQFITFYQKSFDTIHHPSMWMNKWDTLCSMLGMYTILWDKHNALISGHVRISIWVRRNNVNQYFFFWQGGKKRGSDALWFLARVHCFQYRN